MSKVNNDRINELINSGALTVTGVDFCAIDADELSDMITVGIDPMEEPAVDEPSVEIVEEVPVPETVGEVPIEPVITEPEPEPVVEEVPVPETVVEEPTVEAVEEVSEPVVEQPKPTKKRSSKKVSQKDVEA